jgi:hypothetical protein
VVPGHVLTEVALAGSRATLACASIHCRECACCACLLPQQLFHSARSFPLFPRPSTSKHDGTCSCLVGCSTGQAARSTRRNSQCEHIVGLNSVLSFVILAARRGIRSAQVQGTLNSVCNTSPHLASHHFAFPHQRPVLRHSLACASLERNKRLPRKRWNFG